MKQNRIARQLHEEMKCLICSYTEVTFLMPWKPRWII